jgi:hypothetical protein
MRVFSFAFHLLLGLVMMAIGFVAWVSSQHTLQIGFLPWQGPALTYWLFFAGLAGVLLTVLAILRVLPFLFSLWSLAVVVMLVRGVFFSGFNFGYAANTVGAALESVAGSTAFLLLLGALLAAVGSVVQLRSRTAGARRRVALA